MLKIDSPKQKSLQFPAVASAGGQLLLARSCVLPLAAAAELRTRLYGLGRIRRERCHAPAMNMEDGSRGQEILAFATEVNWQCVVNPNFCTQRDVG